MQENVRMFYQKWMEEQAQKLVDATARAFTQGRMGAAQGGPPPRMPMVLFCIALHRLVGGIVSTSMSIFFPQNLELSQAAIF